MVRLILAGLLWTVMALGAAAQSSDIEATIGAQVEAFRADDLATAFSYASPTIQGLFQTPENFGAMVRRGYPMVWRPAEIRYLGLRQEDGLFWQRVFVSDAQGGVHILDYQMIELETGWKINAVYLVRPPGVAA